MNKKAVLIIVFLLILFFAASFIDSQKRTQLCFESNCFDAELALTSKEREQGLMFRDYLEEKEGMLFVFTAEEEYGFWMKDTAIPLDMIWLNEDKEVVFISKNNQPCDNDECSAVNPDKKAKYVLELNGGTADKIGLEVGDRADFNFDF